MSDQYLQWDRIYDMNLKRGKWIKWQGDLLQIVDDDSVFWFCHPMGEFLYDGNKDGTGMVYIDKELPFEYPDDLEDPTVSEVNDRINWLYALYK